MKLKFNMQDWLAILSSIRLEESDPNQDFSPSYKKEVIARNEEKKIFTQFLAELKKKKSDNKELIDVPETKHQLIERIIRNILNDEKNKKYYYTWLSNNNVPNYQELVWRMSDENRRDNVVLKYDIFSNEDSLLSIFQNAISLCPPAEVQSAFEYFAEQYAELDKIDSKKETEEQRDIMLSEFHKAMRQTDMFGNGHACSIIYNLWHISDIVIRAMIAVTEHVKELEKAKT